MSPASPASGSPRVQQRVRRGLGVVQVLGALGVGEPLAQGVAGRRVEAATVAQVEPRARTGRGADGDAGGLTPHAERARHGEGATVGAVLLQPGRDLGAHRAVDVELEPALGLGLGRRQVLEQAVAQHPELEAVEDPVHLLAVPRLRLQVVDLHRQVEVVDQPVEPAVAQHAVEVLAQVLARLALDLVDHGDDAVEVAVGGDPLRGGLGPDAGHPRQVVAGLPHQGGQVGVQARAAPRTSPRPWPASSGSARRHRAPGTATWWCRRRAGRRHGRRWRSRPPCRPRDPVGSGWR